METMYRNEVDSPGAAGLDHNRPRPDDDAPPGCHLRYLGIPMFSTTQAPYDLGAHGRKFHERRCRHGVQQ